MKVIRPIQITASKVISSTAVEEYGAWSNATTYAEGDRVIYNNKIYESVVASNLNKQPDTNPTSWLFVSADNKMSMFDLQVNTQTTAMDTLTVVFKPGKSFTALAFLNIIGVSISVVVRDGVGGAVVYSNTVSLDNSSISVVDWYTYFFEDFDFFTEAVFQNIPPYNDGVVEVSISGNVGSLVAIGACTVGTVIELGDTQYGANYGIRDYSVNETDQFGNTEFVERPFSKRMNALLYTPNERLNYVTKTLQGLRAVPTVYIGAEDPKYQGTIIFGFLKDWNIEINYPNHSMISTEVMGLI